MYESGLDQSRYSMVHSVSYRVPIYIRNCRKQAIMLKTSHSIDTFQLTKAVLNRFKVPLNEQVLFYNGQEIYPTESSNMTMVPECIVHLVDRRNVKPLINIKIRRMTNDQAYIYSIDSTMKISAFFEQFMDKAEIDKFFLVYTSRHLKRHKSFAEELVEDNCQLFCLHEENDWVVEDSNRLNISKIEMTSKIEITSKIQPEKNSHSEIPLYSHIKDSSEQFKLNEEGSYSEKFLGNLDKADCLKENESVKLIHADSIQDLNRESIITIEKENCESMNHLSEKEFSEIVFGSRKEILQNSQKQIVQKIANSETKIAEEVFEMESNQMDSNRRESNRRDSNREIPENYSASNNYPEASINLGKYTIQPIMEVSNDSINFGSEIESQNSQIKGQNWQTKGQRVQNEGQQTENSLIEGSQFKILQSGISFMKSETPSDYSKSQQSIVICEPSQPSEIELSLHEDSRSNGQSIQYNFETGLASKISIGEGSEEVDAKTQFSHQLLPIHDFSRKQFSSIEEQIVQALDVESSIQQPQTYLQKGPSQKGQGSYISQQEIAPQQPNEEIQRSQITPNNASEEQIAPSQISLCKITPNKMSQKLLMQSEMIPNNEFEEQITRNHISQRQINTEALLSEKLLMPSEMTPNNKFEEEMLVSGVSLSKITSKEQPQQQFQQSQSKIAQCDETPRKISEKEICKIELSPRSFSQKEIQQKKKSQRMISHQNIYLEQICQAPAQSVSSSKSQVFEEISQPNIVIHVADESSFVSERINVDVSSNGSMDSSLSNFKKIKVEDSNEEKLLQSDQGQNGNLSIQEVSNTNPTNVLNSVDVSSPGFYLEDHSISSIMERDESHNPENIRKAEDINMFTTVINGLNNDSTQVRPDSFSQSQPEESFEYRAPETINGAHMMLPHEEIKEERDQESILSEKNTKSRIFENEDISNVPEKRDSKSILAGVSQIVDESLPAQDQESVVKVECISDVKPILAGVSQIVNENHLAQAEESAINIECFSDVKPFLAGASQIVNESHLARAEESAIKTQSISGVKSILAGVSQIVDESLPAQDEESIIKAECISGVRSLMISIAANLSREFSSVIENEKCENPSEEQFSGIEVDKFFEKHGATIFNEESVEDDLLLEEESCEESQENGEQNCENGEQNEFLKMGNKSKLQPPKSILMKKYDLQLKAGELVYSCEMKSLHALDLNTKLHGIATVPHGVSIQ